MTPEMNHVSAVNIHIHMGYLLDLLGVLGKYCFVIINYLFKCFWLRQGAQGEGILCVRVSVCPCVRAGYFAK